MDDATNVTEVGDNVTADGDIVTFVDGEQQTVLTGDGIDTSQYYVVRKGEYEGMQAEIERLRATLAGWSQDISNLEDENEKLNNMIKLLQTEFADNSGDSSHIKWAIVKEFPKLTDALQEIQRLRQREKDILAGIQLVVKHGLGEGY